MYALYGRYLLLSSRKMRCRVNSSLMGSIILLLLSRFRSALHVSDQEGKIKIFTKGGFRKSFCAMLIGFLVGFGTNALISLLAGVSGTVHYSFNTFSWYVTALLLPAFIKCSCEEVLLRAYAAPYMEDQNHWSAAAVSIRPGM